MEIDEQLRCLFTGRIEEREGTYTIEIPKREIELDGLDAGDTYRVAVLSTPADGDTRSADSTTATEPESPPEPPVEEGDVRELDIETIGDQGDGIARVERGFVVIVPDTEQGDRVTVEINDVRKTVAFAEVRERHSHF